jgi:hypothetical protein
MYLYNIVARLRQFDGKAVRIVANDGRLATRQLLVRMT